MALREYAPFETLWSEMAKDFFHHETSRGRYHVVREDNDASVLYVNAPGYKTEDITVEMNEGVLSVRGKPSVKHKSIGVLIPNQIDLHFTISPTFIVDGAELSDGILAVALKKMTRTETVKIPVQTK
jgi:HSP20 family molecular chaperone IbpA